MHHLQAQQQQQQPFQVSFYFHYIWLCPRDWHMSDICTKHQPLPNLIMWSVFQPFVATFFCFSTNAEAALLFRVQAGIFKWHKKGPLCKHCCHSKPKLKKKWTENCLLYSCWMIITERKKSVKLLRSEVFWGEYNLLPYTDLPYASLP